MMQLVLFETGKIHFALERKDISQIASPQNGFSSGRCRILSQTVLLKSGSLTLIDLAATANRDSEQPYPPELKIIKLKAVPSLGLLAEQVYGVLDIDTEHMDVLPPVFTGKARTCFPRTVRLDDHLALVIDAATLPKLFDVPPSEYARANNKPPAAHGGRRALPAHPEKATPDTPNLKAPLAPKLQNKIGLGAGLGRSD